MSHASAVMKLKLAIADVRDVLAKDVADDTYTIRTIANRMEGYADELEDDELEGGVDVDCVKEIITRIERSRYDTDRKTKIERYLKALEEAVGVNSALDEYRAEKRRDDVRREVTEAEVELAIEVTKALGRGLSSLFKSVGSAVSRTAESASRTNPFRKAN